MGKLTTCSIPGCGRGGKLARGWCTMHYQRWSAHGTPFHEKARVNAGPCSAEGCASPARKRGWCESHYSQWRREKRVGALAFKHAERTPCRVCGKKNGDSEYRTYCSSACYMLSREHGGDVPDGVACVGCGDWVSYLPEHNGGSRKKSSARSCSKCTRAPLTVTAWDLAARDGNKCGICGEDVDMSLSPRSPEGPTRDHIWPWSLGGSDDPENLRLAHNACNIRRGNRVGHEIIA